MLSWLDKTIAAFPTRFSPARSRLASSLSHVAPISSQMAGDDRNDLVACGNLNRALQW